MTSNIEANESYAYPLSPHQPYQHQLYQAALDYRKHGLSPIPLVGQKASTIGDAKKPTIKAWQQYGTQPASDKQIEQWFLETKYGGIGLVCSQRHRVLDIDDPAIAERFAHQFPELTDTFTIRSASRALPHYYYLVPPDIPPQTKKWTGVGEFRGRDSYVVAPPTQACGKAWLIVNNAPMRLLTAEEYQWIIQFFKNLVEQKAPTTQPSVLQPINGSLSPQALLDAYRDRIASGSGRNDALFYTAIQARDSGWTKEAVIKVLAEIHAHKPPPSGQPKESISKRLAEARRTIHSAFNPKYPVISQASPGDNADPTQPKGLENPIREALLQHGLHQVARVLDGLYMSGWEDHRSFTEKEAVATLALYGIGRTILLKALKAEINWQPIFDSACPDYRHSLTATEQECSVYGHGESKIKRRGRPTSRFYVLPSQVSLRDRLGVQSQRSDRLGSEELGTLSDYKKAMLRRLIQRRPGQYSLIWLGKFVSVSPRTVSRYLRQIEGIRIEPRYQETAINWKNIRDCVPVDPRQDWGGCWGYWLEDEGGKRYIPAYWQAVQLLRAGQKIWLMKRLPNCYSIVEVVASGLNSADDSQEIEQLTAADLHHEVAVRDQQFMLLPDASMTSIEKPNSVDNSEREDFNWNDIPPASDDLLNEDEISRIEFEAMAELV